MNNHAYLSAYRNTDYIVFEPELIILTVDKISPSMNQIMSRLNTSSAAFITAWNPRSQPTQLEDNCRAQQRLIANLRTLGLKFFHGVGKARDDSWPAEESLLVLGADKEQADRLAAKYHQNAWLWIEKNQPVELVFTSEFSSI